MPRKPNQSKVWKVIGTVSGKESVDELISTKFVSLHHRFHLKSAEKDLFICRSKTKFGCPYQLYVLMPHDSTEFIVHESGTHDHTDYKKCLSNDMRKVADPTIKAALMMIPTDTLKQQVLINHFTNATGCTTDQARQILQEYRWEFETALSAFLQEAVVPNQRHISGGLNPMCAPCNTPATPPSFPDALLALQKWQIGDWSSPQQASNPKVLSSFNPLPSTNDRYSTSCDGSGASVGQTDSGMAIRNSENNTVMAVSPQQSFLMFPIEAQR